MDKHIFHMLKDFNEVSYTGNMMEILDNGGRRTGIDRRYYTYTGHIPERRTGSDRRVKEDRRTNAQDISTNNMLDIIERRKLLN